MAASGWDGLRGTDRTQNPKSKSTTVSLPTTRLSFISAEQVEYEKNRVPERNITYKHFGFFYFLP